MTPVHRPGLDIVQTKADVYFNIINGSTNFIKGEQRRKSGEKRKDRKKEATEEEKGCSEKEKLVTYHLEMDCSARCSCLCPCFVNLL